jgi:hypothetical protein
MTASLDIGRLLWLGTLLTLAVWLPAAIARRTWRPSQSQMLAQFVTTAVTTIVAVTVLSPLRLLNPITLMAAYVCWPVAAWAIRHRGSIGSHVQAAGRRVGLRIAIMLDEGTWRTTFPARLLAAERALHQSVRAFAHSAAGITTLAIVLIVIVSVAPRLSAALGSTRLAHPDAYGDLLATEQLLAGESGWVPPRTLADGAAALSLVSAIAPVHLLRLLVPLVGGALVLALIITVRRITGRLGPALIAAVVLSLAALTPIQARTSANELGDVFLLIAIYLWYETLIGARTNARAAVACTALVALTTPLSALANLPLTLAMVCGLGSHLLGMLLGIEWRAGRLPIWATAAAIVGLAIVPRSAGAYYVEYDLAAQKTLEIADRFPKNRWMIVAPIEQFVLTYGRGWHQHLYDFVDQIGPRADSPGFRLPFKVDDVFVFVETRPFSTFANEPTSVPFSALTDPVFRHYRSLAGRASLEFAAYNVCERLRKNDAGATIYFENARLRIYRFTLR